MKRKPSKSGFTKLLATDTTLLSADPLIGLLALAAGNTSALDDPAKMSPFFTDAGMKTLRSETDFTTAWKAMKPDEQKAVLKDCGDTTLNKSHADFCAMAKKMGG